MAQNAFEAMSGVTFLVRDGIDIIRVENQYASAEITTFGGSVLSYVPKGHQDLLWVSGSAVYDGSKPVRGGIPVCWPWFGKAETSGLPAHGFVRSMLWRLQQVDQSESGVVSVTLACESNAETKKYWPYAFKLLLNIQIGSALTLSLTTHNLNSEEMCITEALHTYFSVGNPEGLIVSGLEGAVHLDKLVDDAAPETQDDVVEVHPAKDSVYLDQVGKAVIEDKHNNRRIVIEKSESQSSVVWNPGPDIVQGFADIDNDAWLEFVCVESGNVLDNVVRIPAQSTHTLSVQYSILAD